MQDVQQIELGHTTDALLRAEDADESTGFETMTPTSASVQAWRTADTGALCVEVTVRFMMKGGSTMYLVMDEDVTPADDVLDASVFVGRVVLRQPKTKEERTLAVETQSGHQTARYVSPGGRRSASFKTVVIVTGDSPDGSVQSGLVISACTVTTRWPQMPLAGGPASGFSAPR